MEYVRWFIDLFLHLDRHLAQVIASYGPYTYGLLFAVIFLETGLVVTPFLPGDSLLFAAGTFAAVKESGLSVGLLFGLLAFAAILGDTVNYAIGAYLGPKVFHYPKSRFFNPEHLRRTHAFYERHGGKTIVIARFLPIIRTFAPFVAGIGAMSYLHFLAYNMFGGALWVAICVFGGYFFGQQPFVRNNFSVVIIALVIIPGLPALVAFVRQYLADRRARATS
jgi:membrane-associated protein